MPRYVHTYVQAVVVVVGGVAKVHTYMYVQAVGVVVGVVAKVHTYVQAVVVVVGVVAEVHTYVQVVVAVSWAYSVSLVASHRYSHSAFDISASLKKALIPLEHFLKYHF